MTKRKMLKGGSLSPDEIQGFLKKSYEKKPSSFQGYQIDKSLSGERVQVYYNPTLQQAVVVHRGSAGAKDWLVNDAGLLVGYRGDRFSHAKDIQNKAEKKYGAKNVTTLGHSLGAKIAEEVGQNSKEIITLNKPTVDTKKVSGKQYDIRTSSDLVSGLSGIASSKNQTTIPSGFRNPYSEHSPDVLSRLDDKPIGKGRRGGSSQREWGFITDEEDRRREAVRQYQDIYNRVQLILNTDDLDSFRAHIRNRALRGLEELENEARIIFREYPEYQQLNILADLINQTIETERRRIQEETVEFLTNITARNIRPFKPPTLPPPKRGGSQQLREYNQANIDFLTQEEARLRGLYNQALGAGAGNNTLLEYLENLQNDIISVEVDFGNQGWVSAIFDGLTDEIFESRLALEAEIEAEQEEYDGVTDDELSSLEGGARNQPDKDKVYKTPMTPEERERLRLLRIQQEQERRQRVIALQQRILALNRQLKHVKDTYNSIIDNPDLDVKAKHERLITLIRRFRQWLDTQQDHSPRERKLFTNLLEQLDDQLDYYSDLIERGFDDEEDDEEEDEEEDEDEGEEKEEAQQGGRAINPRSIVPDLMTDEDRAEMARRRIEERRQDAMEQMFQRIRLAPIQNPDTMRRAIRPRNIGAPTGGGSCFSSGRIHPEEYEYYDGDTITTQESREDRELDDFYRNLPDFDIESDATGGGQGDSRVVPVNYTENELNNPVDELDNPVPDAEPTQKPIDTYRQIQAFKIMEEKKLAELEEKYFGWKESAEEEGYGDDLPYNNSEVDENHMIEQMNQAQGMIEYYTQTEENLRREMGIMDEPSGGGRFDCYSRCHDCGCDSYRDFNALHAM
jgi:hypothetical protein